MYDMDDEGPKEIFSKQLQRDKYAIQSEEDHRGIVRRVAAGLADPGRERLELEELLSDQRFLPAGRIMAAIGAPKAVTPYNCFVSGKIPDSFITRDNPENSSIMHRAEQAAATMRMGGGIGYNFGTLRPDGALIKKLMSRSNGPLAFMPIFDAVCKATSSAGNRRGAQMSVLPVWHPDILKYIRAKQTPGMLEGFNMSIGITDDFMEALDRNTTFDLRFDGEVYATVDAAELWDEIMRSTHKWAEPGVLFLDRINRRNNLWYCEEIAATNPCGEQPLPPFGACLLGSFNLVKYIVRQPNGVYDFDYEWLAADVPVAVRALDNVIDVALYPLPEQEQEAKSKRRMGIGVTGLANALEAMGYPYGTAGFVEIEHKIMHLIQRECYLEGTRLARTRGRFPLFDSDAYCSGQHFKTLDKDVQHEIMKYGLRNSHYTSVAPTGTISMTADNISSSIEPVYRWYQQRQVIMPEGRVEVDLYDHGFKYLRTRGRRTSMGEVSAHEHIAVLCAAQTHVDSAVSKTVNMDGSMPFVEFKQLYIDAYLGGAKGCTTYNKDGKRAGLFRETPEASDMPFPISNYVAADMNFATSAEFQMSCEWDPATGRKSCE